MSYPKVSHVMFLANINIDGRAGNNIDAVRDGIDLAWHEPTGGVIVDQGGKQHYVSPQSIMSVTFAEPLPMTDASVAAQSDLVKQAEQDAQDNEEELTKDSGLADKVLDEFQENKDVTPNPTRKTKASRS